MTTYKVTVDSDTTRWYNSKDQLHRENGPAVEYTSGTKVWYIKGQCHREDGPAVEWAGGTKSWYLNGQQVTEAQVMKSCEGRTLTIDGVQYKLVKL